MKKLFLGSVALVALGAGSSAMAADLPVKAPVFSAAPTPSWAGPYFGIRGGYGWGDADYTNLGGSAAGGTFGGVTVPFSNTLGPIGFEDSHRVKGGILGYVSGINWQTGAFVYGLEHTFAWTGIKGTTGDIRRPVPPAIFVPRGILASNLKWYGTAETRLGLVSGNSLFYVKGGLAAGRLDVSGSRTNGASNGDNFNQKDYRAGWTAGGGWDYLITPNWIVGIEGNVVDLGKEAVAGQMVDAAGVGGAGSYNEDVKLRFWNVMGRIAYKWGR